MLKVDRYRERRVTRSFSMLAETIDLLEDMADAYKTNASRVIEAMVQQYGQALIEQAEKDARRRSIIEDEEPNPEPPTTRRTAA